MRLFLLRQFVEKILSTAPLMTMYIPSSMGEITTTGKDKNQMRSGEERRYPPGSSSAPTRSKRGDKAVISPAEPSGGPSSKRSRSSSAKPSDPKKNASSKGRGREDGGRISYPDGSVGARMDANNADRGDSYRRRHLELVGNVEEEDGEESDSESEDDSSSEDTDVQQSDDQSLRAGEEINDCTNDDDDDGEIIVFKPTFSRYQDESPAVHSAPAPDVSMSGAISETVPISSNWLGVVSSGDGSQNVSSSSSWSLFGGENALPQSTEQDYEGERILECLKLGNTPPSEGYGGDDSGMFSTRHIKPSISDPCLWAAVGDHQFSGLGLMNDDSDKADFYGMPYEADNLTWLGNGASRILRPAKDTKQASSGPPPGFEDHVAHASVPQDGPPPGLEKVGNPWIS